MDISARSSSLAARPRRPNGSPGFNRTGKTGLHLSVHSRRPRREACSGCSCSERSGSSSRSRRPSLRQSASSSPHFCSTPPAAHFHPDHGSSWPSRADAVKIGRHADVAACSADPRPHLDGGEHGGRLDVSGAGYHAAAGGHGVTSKFLPLASTAQAMRASLLASAIASTLW